MACSVPPKTFRVPLRVEGEDLDLDSCVYRYPVFMHRLREAGGKMRCTVIHQVLTQLAVFFNTSNHFERVYSRPYYVSPLSFQNSNNDVFEAV